MPATLADVAPMQTTDGVVSLEHNQTIGDAMKVLAKKGILSAPVLVSPDVDEMQGADGQPARAELLGWLDVNDIVREFVNCTEDKLESGSMLKMMAVLEQEGPAFAERQVVTLFGGQDKRLIYEGDKSMALQEAIKVFFMGSGDVPAVHRTAVFDSMGAIEYVISQMDILRYVHAHCQSTAWGQQSLRDAGLVDGRSVVSVDINTPTYKAIKLLVKQSRSAVAVLSPEGGLITNLSTSDLRMLQPNHFGVLALPVGEFLGLLHSAVYVGSHAVDGDLRRTTSRDERTHHRSGSFFAQRPEDHTQQVPLITCTPESTVMKAMTCMVQQHVHRVYVVESTEAEQPAPLAVVTTTDMMNLIAAEFDG